MTRPSRLLALPLVLATALTLAACGEQTPGGSKAEGGGQQQAQQQGQAQGQKAQPEQDKDAEKPIVVKIGDKEYKSITAIYNKYDKAKSGPMNLQSPTGDVKDVKGGKMQTFATGNVYWSKATGAHIVRGELLKTYLDNQGPDGKLGLPIGDETTENGTVYSQFQNGRIELKNMAIQVILDH